METLYADFDNSCPESVDKLESMLQRTSPTIDTGGSCKGPSAPSTSSTTSVAPASNWCPASKTNQLTPEPAPHRPLVTASMPCPSLVKEAKKYLELCVNTGEFSKSLGEIEISQVRSDGSLFREIRSNYLRLRGYRAKHFLLKPVAVQFVQVSTTLMPQYFIPFLKVSSSLLKRDIKSASSTSHSLFPRRPKS